MKKLKEDCISSAYKELNESIVRCNIPSKDQLLLATKENPLQWNSFESFWERSEIQSEESFQEQKRVIKFCTDPINDYCNIFRTNMVKSCSIRGYAGCGKSWCMQYCLLYCISRGLFGLPTSVMSRRSVFLGSKHIDYIFCLPFEKNRMSPYQIAELAILRLSRYPEKLNVLIVLDVIFFDEIGQLPAETFSALK